MIVVDTAPGLYGRSLVTFAKRGGGALPSTSFRTRDVVRLVASGGAASAAAATDADASTGVIYRMRETSVTVAFEELPAEVESGHSVGLLKLANEVTYKRYLEAMNEVERVMNAKGPATEEMPSVEMARVMFGHEEVRFHKKAQAWTPLDQQLNVKQLEAVELALSAQHVALIHGPPGTGKTTTVVEVIRQLVETGQRVLACAPSNIAVDNLTEKLVAHGVAVCRMGHPARVMPQVLPHSLESLVLRSDDAQLASDIRKEMAEALRNMRKTSDRSERYQLRATMKELRKELRQRERRAVKSVLESASVILSTTTGAASRNLNGIVFDTVVIDECAQDVEPGCWIPLLRGRRAVLAGDHKQLPPTIQSKEAARRGLETTLFDRLARSLGDRGALCMLTEQYRMHETIMRWASDAMYGGKLTAHASVAKHLLCDVEHVTDSELTRTPLVFIDTAGADMFEAEEEGTESKSNPEEAALVVAHVEALIDKAGMHPREVAVITPYNGQVNALRELLQDRYRGLEIGTVDGFQGREKEAIVISMVRSNGERKVGFLSEDRRTNVAVTRARRHCAVIGDSGTISAHKFLAGLVSYCADKAEYASATVLPLDIYGHTSEEAAMEVDAEAQRMAAEALAQYQARKAQAQAKGNGSMSAQRKSSKKKKKQKSARPVVAKVEAVEPQVVAAEDDDGELIELTRHNFDEATCARFVRQLWRKWERSKGDDAEQEYRMSATLANTQRLRVHRVIESLGLSIEHKSEGMGKKRHVVLRPRTKPAGVTNAEAVEAARAELDKPVEVASTGFSDDELEMPKKASKGSSKRKSKKKSKKKKAKKQPVQPKPQEDGENDDEEDDLDDILKEFDTSRCASDGCSRKVNDYSGFVCQHCNERYCRSHVSPALHDCTNLDAWRATHRSNLRGGPKALKSQERAALLHRLHKTIDTKQGERTADDAKKTKSSSKKKKKKGRKRG